MENLRNQLDYKNKEAIGNGASGIAYKIYNFKDRKYYLLKQIFLKKINDIKCAENESNILKNINHDNIVKYHDSFIEKGSFYIIMEFCENLDLTEFIRQYKEMKKLIDKNVIYNIIMEICLGLKEIHNKNLIHRDLKPDNIFISEDFKIKLGDFGISKQLIGTKHANTITGTSNYMAPEILKGEKYDNKVDIWSLGCIVYELCTLNICFKCEYDTGLVNMIKEGIYDKSRLKEYSNEWINLIELLLKVDKADRPDINEVFKILYDFKNIQYIFEENFLNSLDRISYNILKNIEIMNLSNKNIGNEELINLNQINFKELKELDLSKNKISDIMILEKVKFEKLEKLDLSKNEISNINVLDKINLKN